MTKPQGFDPLSIVSKLARQEKELHNSSFIAPYVGGGKVRLRLEGIIYELEVGDCPDGWAIMQVIGDGKARFLQRAPLPAVKKYLQLLPRLRLILVDRFDTRWWALAALSGGQKIEISGPVPVYLAETATSFDTVYCRFDGASFWFDSIDRRRDPAIARQLRQAIARDVPPEMLNCKGMLPSELLAYKMLWFEKHKGEKAKADIKTRISSALEHAGASLESFWYTDGNKRASARFQVDGNTHVVEFDPHDLSIVSSGICLSGEDSKFDLSSLVGVLREAEREY
jgi:hypothetical protein